MGEIQEFDKEKKVEEEEQQEGLALKIWDCVSPLYDSYELVSITNVLDKHLKKLPFAINRSTRPITRPSSYPSSSQVPLSYSSMATTSSSKMSKCLSMPSFKLFKMNKVSEIKVGILKTCHKIVSCNK